MSMMSLANPTPAKTKKTARRKTILDLRGVVRQGLRESIGSGEVLLDIENGAGASIPILTRQLTRPAWSGFYSEGLGPSEISYTGS